MEQDKNKIQEPYSPENTPTPPQIIDPSLGDERENAKPAKKNDRAAKPAPDAEGTGYEKKPNATTESEDEVEDQKGI